MDLSRSLELAAARGSIFWIATCAVALGMALLAASLVQMARRRKAHGWSIRLPRRRRPKPERGQATAPAEVYCPAGPALSVAAGQAAEEPSLALLLRRLQSAGDRLEEIAADLASDRFLPDESILKEESHDVEYVFKACGP
ncbi:MAG TPA: hypothetical protein PLL30_07525 [Candidatus Krumholzibacteria bacterium]|nr:hypothetical protein [Candidatus Krumholzibacteria bacterium]HPD71605.1 hypothetical protein [Candidatus Krumholzibacteria bacterium]HRY41462.1 hypothetical protein [Candidatus Krumholzibacteria bacterium]